MYLVPIYLSMNIACNCNYPEGSLGKSCDDGGICTCQENFATPKCKTCNPDSYKDGSNCLSKFFKLYTSYIL